MKQLGTIPGMFGTTTVRITVDSQRTNEFYVRSEIQVLGSDLESVVEDSVNAALERLFADPRYLIDSMQRITDAGSSMPLRIRVEFDVSAWTKAPR